MLSWRGLIFGLLTGFLAGCASEPVRSTAWLDRFRNGAASGPDIIQMDVVLIERPLGDKYLNQGIWDAADELIALESKSALESNGFRIGQIGGMTPTDLQELLSSPRSCPNPRRVRRPIGKPLRLDLGPEMPVCQFQLQRDGAPVAVRLDQAQCALEVTPTRLPDGRIRFHFEPRVEHGQASLLPKPTADRSSWMVHSERPAERYAALGWEVTLAANEYALVGGRFDLPQTLGHQCFIRRDERSPVQRLLMIRAVCPAASPDEVAGLIADPVSLDQVPSLTRRTATAPNPTARGISP